VSVDEVVCREFAELATDYLDGAMPDETLELVEEHLAMCDWCRDYLAQIETTVAAVAAEPPDAAPVAAPALEPPPATLDALVGAFRAQAKGDPG
jgi:predicted anti-sigma-YlaC factor YlaD